jgi:lysophospholipase L1-like esterase
MKTNVRVINQRILRLRNQPQLKVVALGDSISFGVGDTGGHENAIGPGWVGRIAHDLGAAHFLNFSRNGARVRDLTGSRLSAALEVRPDLVLICVGGNDVLRGNFNPIEIKNGLLKLISRFESIDAAVVLVNLPHLAGPLRVPALIRNVFAARANILNEILAEVCSASSAEYVCLSSISAIKERNFWHVDKMHPSPLGHQLIADKVRRSLSLPRRTRKKIAFDNNGSSKLRTAKWLLVKGSIWILRRSVDLVPAIIFIIVKESIRGTARRKSLRTQSVVATKKVSSYFNIETIERDVAVLTANAYRATSSNSRGELKNVAKDLISFPA